MYLEQLNARLVTKQDTSSLGLLSRDLIGYASSSNNFEDYEEVQKGLGKGAGRGRPKGSKNKNGGGTSASEAPQKTSPVPDMPAPRTNITGDAYEGHNAEDVRDAFNHTGKMLGGSNIASNVMTHKDKSQAQIHEGAVHGHLQDSGFKQGATTATNNGTSTEYAHPNGTKVTVNAGSSDGKHYVGYRHDTSGVDYSKSSSTAPKEEPKKETAAITPPVAPKAVPMAAIPKNPSVIGADGKVDAAKFKRGLSKIAGLTDMNEHSKALIHGAKLIGRQDLADRAKDIDKQHTKQGHMSSDLQAKRMAVHDELHAHAKKVLSPEQAKSLYMSY